MICQIFYFFHYTVLILLYSYTSTFQSFCTDTVHNCSVEADEGCWVIEKL